MRWRRPGRPGRGSGSSRSCSTIPAVMMWGGELLLRDGVAAGLVTSAAWGATIGASVAMAYVRHPDGDVVTPDYLRSGRYQVNVGGQVCGATRVAAPAVRPGRGEGAPVTVPAELGAPAARRRTARCRSACSTCSRSGSGRPARTPSARCGRRRCSRTSLAAGRPARPVAGVRVELFGSLGATGHGHGSVPAVVLGLMGEHPETVDPSAAAAVVERVRESGKLPARGCGGGRASSGARDRLRRRRGRRPAPAQAAAVPLQRDAVQRDRRRTPGSCQRGRTTRSAAGSCSARTRRAGRGWCPTP